jgi:putative ABC transport system permease protein
MIWIAMKMLTGDRRKYYAIVFGVAFGCLLIAEQSATFCGVMLRTVGAVLDTHDADVWVVNPAVENLDDLKPISDNAVLRVRGVPGVAWAVPRFQGMAQIQIAEGKFHNVELIGLDDASLAGAPITLIAGKVADLRTADAIVIDQTGFEQLWPQEPVRLGKRVEINGRRAVVVGICQASPSFMTLPIVYTRLSQAGRFVPAAARSSRCSTMVLVRCQAGASPEEVARSIEERTGLKALSSDAFAQLTIDYYLDNTGIPLNFAATVLLGFLVGCAIAGQTFYLFTVENLRQFAALKAMGVSDARVVGMIVTQALVVASLGYGLGVGAAAIVGLVAQRMSPLMAFSLPWQVLAITAGAVLLIALCSSLLSIRRVLVLEPALIFQR